MSSKLNPYLSFRNDAREAMTFYKEVFGGDVTISTFGENHAPVQPGEEQLVMHSVLEAPNGISFMASDSPAHVGEYRPGTNFSMSLSGEDEQELRGYFEKLAAGGTIAQPLEKAPWGDTFGMCTDRFGINWLVNISAA